MCGQGSTGTLSSRLWLVIGAVQAQYERLCLSKSAARTPSAHRCFVKSGFIALEQRKRSFRPHFYATYRVITSPMGHAICARISNSPSQDSYVACGPTGRFPFSGAGEATSHMCIANRPQTGIAALSRGPIVEGDGAQQTCKCYSGTRGEYATASPMDQPPRLDVIGRST